MDEKELFEQFMHHNIPQEAFDPDQVLAAARKAVPVSYTHLSIQNFFSENVSFFPFDSTSFYFHYRKSILFCQ